MGRLWERYNPIILGFLAVGITWFFKLKPSIAGFEKVLDGVITFSSIVIGFLGALLAIILSISKSNVIQHLYKHVHHTKGKNYFYNYFQEAIIVGFIVVISSIFMYVFRKMTTLPWYGHMTFYIWIFSTAFFLAAAFRIINILMLTLFVESQKSHQEEYKQKSILSPEELENLKRQATKK